MSAFFLLLGLGSAPLKAGTCWEVFQSFSRREIYLQDWAFTAVSPFAARRLYRGVRGIPVRVTSQQLKHFIVRRSEIQSGSKVGSHGSAPKYQTEKLAYSPTQPFQAFLKETRRCEGCTHEERELMSYLVNAIVHSIKPQCFSPYRSEAKGWGALSTVYSDLDSRVNTRHPSVRLVEHWSQLAFVLSADRTQVGPIDRKTIPIPPFDSEFQALANADVVFARPLSESATLVWFDGKWHYPKNGGLEKKWKSRIDIFDLAIEILFEGMDRGVSAKQLAEKISAIEID